MVALARLILILAFCLGFVVFVVARFVKKHATPGIKAARVLSEALYRQTHVDWEEEVKAARAHAKQLVDRS